MATVTNVQSDVEMTVHGRATHSPKSMTEHVRQPSKSREKKYETKQRGKKNANEDIVHTDRHSNDGQSNNNN